MDETTTTLLPDTDPALAARERRLSLVILWYGADPSRVGEALLCPAGDRGVVGRGRGGTGDPGVRLLPHRMRPGRTQRRGPLADRALSRVHWVLHTEEDGHALSVQAVGRRPTLLNGQPISDAVVRPGHQLHIPGVLLVRVERREDPLPPLRPGLAYPDHPFGQADAFGIVGESPAAWALRERLAFVAGRPGHVLVLGPSGAGKELAARAIHALSRRADGPWVARNAATLPDGLVDAELFGHVKNYPDHGMPARPGLVGQADGGTLFLDEIAELPASSQTHLLRVLDDGEYQRLGSGRSSRSDLRVVGATNRDISLLKHDLAARLLQRVHLAGLEERVCDVPLIAAHLFGRMAAEDPVLDAFMTEGHPRFASALVERLIRDLAQDPVRGVQRALIEAAGASRGTLLQPATPDLPREDDPAEPVEEPDADTVRAALDAEDWVVSRAWSRLGLRNRYQLYRLIRRYGLERG